MRMIDEVHGLKEKPEDPRFIKKDYIKIRPGVRAKDSIPNFAIIGNCRFGNGQGVGEIHTKVHHLHMTVDNRETPVQVLRL